jgi:hypothetical protein
MHFPDWSQPIEIETDASRHAIAGWAFQTINGERLPIAFISRSVSDAEKKYCDILGIHESTGYETRQIETLAIIYVLEELNYLLEGSQKVTIRTDHRNILWLRDYSKPNGRLLRWAIRLSQATEGANIEYIKGIDNHTADAMSRLHSCCTLMLEEHEGPNESTKKFSVHLAEKIQANEQLCVLPAKRSAFSGETGRYAMKISYQHEDIASLTNLWSTQDEVERTLIPKETTTPVTREQIIDAQQKDEPTKIIRKALMELHELCQPKSTIMEDGEAFNSGIVPIFSQPLKDIETMIHTLSITKTAKRTLCQLARRYRLDGLLEMVYVRPKSKAEPHVHENPAGDMATTRASGPSTNEAVLIPNSDEALALRVQCIRGCHDSLIGGSHHGPHSTYARCRARFHWINMQEDVRSYCAACIWCKRAKSNITSRMGLLQSFERTLPNDDIALDILTFKGKSSRGQNCEQHILVMYDIFSHFLIARQLQTRSLEAMCDVIIKYLILPYGAPKRFIADNEFFKKNFLGLMKMLKSKANFTSPYHSVGNPAERPLRHLQALLRIWVNCDQYFDEKSHTWTANPPRETHENFSKYGAWPEYLPFVISAYNASPIPGTDISPFEVVFGRPYRLSSDSNLVDTTLPTLDPSFQQAWDQKQKILTEIYDKVRCIHRERAALGEMQYSMNHIFMELKASDLVIVKVPTREGKLAMQYIGPCKVIQKLSDVTYIVRDIRTKRDMRVHVQRLCRFHADSRYGQPYEEGNEQGTQNLEPLQGKLFWPDSEELKETPFESHELVIVRSNFNQRITIGEVINAFHDTNEIEMHVYMHEPNQESAGEYDAHMPLCKRILAPEYNHFTKSGEMRATGTFKPKPDWEPETKIFNLTNIEILARHVVLTNKSRIPDATLGNIKTQYGLI